MITEAFILGGILWWPLVAISSILIIWALEEEKTALAIAALGGGLLLWYLLGDLGTILTIENFTASNILLGIAIYVGVSVFWACTKWWFHLGAERDRYKEDKIEWLEARGIRNTEDVPVSCKEAFAEYLIVNGYYEFIYEWDEEKKKSIRKRVPCILPKPTKNKAKITTWMIFWPWSMIWTLLDGFVKKFFNWLLKQINDLLEWMGNKRFKGLDEDFK